MESQECKICFEHTNLPSNPLISPCACKGSQKYIHRQCLNTWRVYNTGAGAFYQCQTCKVDYQFTKSISQKKRIKAMSMFILKMLLEIVVVCLVSFATITMNTFATMLYMGSYLCFSHFVDTLPMGMFVSLVEFGIGATVYFLVTLCTMPSTPRATSQTTSYNYYDFSTRGSCSGGSKCNKKKGDIDIFAVIIVIFAVIGIIAILCFVFRHLYKKGVEHWRRQWRSQIVDEFIVKDLG